MFFWDTVYYIFLPINVNQNYWNLAELKQVSRALKISKHCCSLLFNLSHLLKLSINK